MSFPWPSSFERILSKSWTQEPLEDLALNYDNVENHGWYSNLDFTVEQVGEYAQEGDILIDYSGGTGILSSRLLKKFGDKNTGIIIVDSSPKFLRLALEKFRDESRVAFRRIHFLKEERRLEGVDEVLGAEMLKRGVDGIVSTNAIHLYPNLEETIRTWKSVLRPTGKLFVQSGNIGNADLPKDEWIIDETVDVIHSKAMEIVQSDDAFKDYRSALGDTDFMSKHDVLRKKYFLPVRPLVYYIDMLRSEGFDVTTVRHERISAQVDEWYEFMSVYHEGVLGWVGGAEKITNEAAPENVIEDRLTLMRMAMNRIFGGAEEFGASWTYITCEPN